MAVIRFRGLGVFTAVFTLFCSTFVWARGAGVHEDLSAGVVYPSNNDSVLLNPAALGRLSGALLDVAALVPEASDAGLLGSYSYAGRGVGVGAGALAFGDDILGFAGFGFGIGPFQLGASVASQVGSGAGSPRLGVGARWGGNSGPAFGIRVDDVSVGLDEATVGIAWSGGQVTFEIDLDIANGLNYAFARPALVFRPSREFSFLLASSFEVMPEFQPSLDDLQIGVNYWLSNGVALYGIYNGMQAKQVAGLKFRF
ncbi:MAG: hypothetical protein A2X94_15825 [Bdellovibrionales bacterium GWB1_55_8]|nr:MAG: hypothetical protein A2X94_15825 [Bdellovibrionales bacterium GWB1_55_8]